MKVIKETDQHIILQRRDGRYAVKAKKGGYINANEKIAILIANDLVKVPESKAPEGPEVVAEEAVATEDAGPVAEETPAGEDSVVEEVPKSE